MALRVTRTIAEVAGTVTSNVRVTRSMADVIGDVAQPDVRLYRLAMHALVEDTGALERTAQSTITFSDSDIVSRPVAVAQTVTFSQVLALISTKNPDVDQTVTFSDSETTLLSLKEVASNSLTFTHATDYSPKALTAGPDTFTFTHSANVVGPVDLSVADTITFSETVGGIFPYTIIHTVTFTDLGGAGVIIPGGIERNAVPDTVTFTDNGWEVNCKASAIEPTASDTVTFSDKALLPISVSIPQSFVLTDSLTFDYLYQLIQEVTFSAPEPSPVTVRPIPVTDNLNFGHAVAYTNRIDLCRYSPSIGTSTDPNAPAPPPGSLSVAKTNQVVLSWPTSSPTETVTIRAPEFGDQHRLNFDRINRETRGGSLQVFADPDWPTQEQLQLQFSVLKEAEAQAVLDFFQTTIGLEIKLEDWYGRTWHGFITEPEAQLIRSRRGVVDLAFEFEGEQQ